MYSCTPFRVLVSTDKGINVILSNRSIEHEKTYSHFMSADDGAFFADTLCRLVAVPARTALEHCAICGNYFLKKDRLCRLKGGAIAHRACFQREVGRKHLDYDDMEHYLPPQFPGGEPEFEFSNLDERSYRFLFAVQIVSDKAIHLYCQSHPSPKRHFVLNKQECLDLAAEIRRQLDAIKNAEVGDCFHCEKKIYVDQERYEMASGELIHAHCMDRFVQSDPSSQIRLPARKIHLVDRFSHAMLFPRHYHTPAFSMK